MSRRDRRSAPKGTDRSEERGPPGSESSREQCPPGGDSPPDPPADEPARIPLEDVLDLHSFQPREIASLVEEYLAEALAAGFAQVRIIHGRGVGVQREIVRGVLARTPCVVSYTNAPPDAGGWGATIAQLRTDAPRNPDEPDDPTTEPLDSSKPGT